LIELYTNENYVEAKELLMKNKSDFTPALFHYNFGTVLYKLNEMGAARYHFEMAKSYGFNAHELKNNIQVIKDELIIGRLEMADGWTEQVYINLTELNSMSFHCLSLFFILLSYFIYKRSKKVLVGCLLLIVALMFQLVFWFHFNQLRHAVVITATDLREGPSKAFTTNRVANEALKVIVRKKDENWYFIEYPVSMLGWIEGKDLGFIIKN
jgi:hypothetical protein